MQSRDLSMFLANYQVIINAVKNNLFPKKGAIHEHKNQAE